MLTEATILRGAFWSAIGAVFELLMSFLLVILIAPLGPTILGIFHLSLRVFHSIVAVFKVRGINKLISEYAQSPKSLKFEETAAFLLKAHFIGGSLAAIFLLILILTFAPFKSLAFLALSIPFAFVNSYLMRLLQLLQRFKQIFIIQAIFVFLFQLIYMLIFVKILRLGIGAAFAGQLLMFILISIVSFVFLFDHLNLLGFFQKINLKMFTRSRISLANVLFRTIFPILDVMLVTLLFGISATGHYVVLLSLPLLLHRIPTTLFGMFIYVARVKTYKGEDLTEVSRQVLKWMLLTAIPLLIIILLFPSEILSFLFHKTYVKDLVVSQILAISYFILSFSWVAERILIAKNKKVERVISNYIFAFAFILFSFIFAFGLLGIALAFIISSAFDALIKCILVIKKTKVFFIGIEHMKILGAGLLGSLAAYLLFFNSPLLFIPFFLILYFAILWIAGVVRQRTFFDLKKMVVKEVTIAESND